MFRMLSTSAVALIVAAAPVLAEVTPVQVWDSLIQSYREMGYTITEGSRDEAGDTLTVNNIVMEIAPAPMPATPTAPNEPSPDKLTLNLPRAVLSRTGDGNVRTVFEGEWTGGLDATLPDGSRGTPMTLSVAMPGNEMVTSGTPEAMNHALNYPEMTARLVLRDDKGTEIPVDLVMSDTKGRYDFNTTAGAGTSTDYDLTTARMTVNLDVDVPTSEDQPGGAFKGQVAMNDVGMTGKMSMPAGDHNMGEDMNAAVKAGADISGTFAIAGYDGTFEFAGKGEDGADQTGNATFSGGKADLAVEVNAQGLRYSGSAGDGKFNIVASSMPFPISYALGNQSFDIRLPLMQGDAAQPFNFKFAMTGLTLGDEIWGLFDQTAQLPRDPADLTIDVSGDMLVTRDLLDQEFNQRMAAASIPAEGTTELTAEQEAELERLQAEALPFQPTRLAINDVTLNAVGAHANLKGELTAPPGGSLEEQPVGTIEGSFTGVNTLIDRLASIGLIPQDQVAGMRMMLMVFAKPVEGQQDAMTTHIELREDGSIFANGQQMQ